MSVAGSLLSMSEKSVKDALDTLGMQTSNNPSTVDTPKRFVAYLREFMQPFSIEELIGDGFEAPKDQGIHGMVVQSEIPFRMICEHHLLPALGKAAVGYIPQDRVLGLSKIARLVDAFGTESPSLQEVISEKIANAFSDYVKAKGVIVVIEAEHGCMGCRGINKPGVVTTTSVVRGVFRDVPSARAEFFSVIGYTRSRSF